MYENKSYIISEKIKKEDRINWKLNIDTIYKADTSKSNNISGEVLSKLLGVKNQGGFRYLGKKESPKLIVLFTSGEDVYWRDEIDNTQGILLYYGDNKTPGTDLHKTNLHGNEMLSVIFEMANSSDLNIRKKIPPILVFKKAINRDVKFLGLAVPGVKSKSTKEWLTAVWGSNKNGDRFLNYKSYFTILDTSSGSDYEKDYGINLAWLNDIEDGKAYESIYAPKEWKKYISNKQFNPLIATSEKRIKTKEEQLPSDSTQIKMLEIIQKYFFDLDRGYSFERFAADLTQYIDSSIAYIEVTQPFKDGGIDAIGKYRIFSNIENVVYVDFYLQAKCYNPNNAVTVKDMARLISRIKNRQFGIMLTTSYIARQAYEELLEDGHPIAIITGKNIVEYIYYELDIKTLEDLEKWLNEEYK